MIYINPDEVYNDYIISKRIIEGKSCENMFFVGAHVTEDIKYCIKKAFASKETIFNEIWRMFEIHELTHKNALMKEINANVGGDEKLIVPVEPSQATDVVDHDEYAKKRNYT